MICGFLGLPGAGKSYALVERGFERAEQQKRYIVANFEIDERAAWIYCKRKKYQWLAEQFWHGRWEFEPEDLTRLLAYKRSVILLDEAGIFLTARDYQKVPQKVIVNLCQARKISSDLYWTSQHEDLVYVNLRRLTNYFFVSDFFSPEVKKRINLGIGYYDFHLIASRLTYKFEEAGLQGWRRNKKALKHCAALPRLTSFDPSVFTVFDSMVRLEDGGFRGLDVRDRLKKLEDRQIAQIAKAKAGDLSGGHTASRPPASWGVNGSGVPTGMLA